jgi:hypothetical protein
MMTQDDDDRDVVGVDWLFLGGMNPRTTPTRGTWMLSLYTGSD